MSQETYQQEYQRKRTINIVLPEESKRDLRAYAKTQNRSMSYVAAQFVVAGLKMVKGK